MKNVDEYHNLYVKNDNLLSANVYKNVRKMYLKFYHLHPENFPLTLGLAW